MAGRLVCWSERERKRWGGLKTSGWERVERGWAIQSIDIQCSGNRINRSSWLKESFSLLCRKIKSHAEYTFHPLREAQKNSHIMILLFGLPPENYM